MFFVLPDLDNDFSAFDEGGGKVVLDQGPPPNVPKSARKVELDLDDAPFLEQENIPLAETAPSGEKQPQDESEHGPETPIPPEAESDAKRPRLLLFAASIVAVLLMATAAVYLLLPASQGMLPSQEIPHLISLEPFYIEQQSAADGMRFLQCRFALPAGNAEVEHEILTKRLLIRDGLFFYLMRREPAFLTQAEEAVTLKKDLLTVVNQFLTSGQLDDILINEYVVR
jgi:flagellar protein FliL